MLKSHEKFHSANGKRRILIVDDEAINREILGMYLQDDYEILYAGDGNEAMTLIRENRDTLSLMLLDILMPVMSGMEVLKALKDDPELSKIPVIILTADQEAEVECLSLGAADFIPKPYPNVDVVRARITRTIELSEDRDIIQSTERDVLTGVYNKEYFYRYAQQYDQYHKDVPMDAVLVDVNHFHMINERYGKAYGDEVLRRIGERVGEIIHKDDGIVCRREADTFMIYCPHREDYREILDSAAEGLAGDESAGNRIRLRMGIYSEVDKTIDIERRFDRAKMAADSVKGSFTRTIAYYDNQLHDRELYSEQLIEDFYKAIEEKQFVVYYQPKYNITGEVPFLSSAEALVRWNHPTLGMISPGVFIPLFEENGLIQDLDNYVWREACRQIREWIDRLEQYVPVSVNVSRIDLYDPGLLNKFQDLIREYGLSYRDILLEVTESAYTQDAEQMVDVVGKLRKLGFQIEMDDFGTGYSSLNMVSTLPFDVMKLDMQFMKSAFKEGGDTRMLELILDIADYLDVPVVAEGVETEDQLNALKTMGCDLVQGFYFSRPVPAEEFEVFLEQRKAADKALSEEAIMSAEEAEAQTEEKALAESLENDSGAIDTAMPEMEETKTASAGGSEDPEKQENPAAKDPSVKGRRSGLHLRTATFFFVAIAVVAAAALFITDISVTRGFQRMKNASDRHLAAQLAASDMESGSDYLTDRVRCFVVTGELEYLKDFFEEVDVTKRRDHALEDLETLTENSNQSAFASMNAALDLSNELVEIEYLAMRLKLETGDYDMSQVPEEISSISLSKEDLALSREEINEKAQNLVFDNNYMHYKDRIRENVNQCTQALIRSSSQELEEASSKMALLVGIQTIMTIVFLLIILALVIFINELIRKPLTHMVDLMRAGKTIPPTGAEELQFVTRTYNTILNENKVANEKLKHEASHDALTGLLNRGAYDLLMQTVDTSHIALIIVDVDYFKSVNDTYGHAVGDRVLKRVAEILRHSFRSVDIICRIGGDEFVVIMTRVNSSMGQLVINKISQANDLLQHPKDDLPPVSLSVGVAFSDRSDPQGDIFKDADTALYRVKEAGRNGCEIY
ncbi:MAG: EAL domain-containing protein [Parasporobacterium sp.]|nr:EAL domain-containing protein [Parasporobacterium sp.]